MTFRACIVDDDPIFVFTAKALMSYLPEIGEIAVCENGQDAFHYVQHCLEGIHEMPHLILLDINMPIWDAWNFLDEYEKLDITEPPSIFVVSSSDHPEDQLRAKSYQTVSGLITKPLTEAVFKELIQTLQHTEH